MPKFCNKCGKPCAIKDQDNPEQYKCVECMGFTDPDLKRQMQETEAFIVLTKYYPVDINVVN